MKGIGMHRICLEHPPVALFGLRKISGDMGRARGEKGFFRRDWRVFGGSGGYGLLVRTYRHSAASHLPA